MEFDENLLSRVSDFLNTDEGARILSDLKSSFGVTDESSKNAAGMPDLSGIFGGAAGAKKEDSPSNNIDISRLIPLISAISSAKTDDRATNLLISLKPLLSKERIPRVDHAISLMKIIALLPILKEYGFSLSDLF